MKVFNDFINMSNSIFAIVTIVFIFGFVRVRADENVAVNDCPRIVSRLGWGAEDASSAASVNFPKLPEFVVICHTVTSACRDLGSCSAIVRAMQTYHKRQKNWGDIGYNFIIGGDGAVYEGRGWDIVGTHSKTYNDKSIAIAFIGNFTDCLPTENATRAARDLIKCGARTGKISQGYKIVGHRQVIATVSPGDKLYDEIKTWDKWSPDDLKENQCRKR